MSTEAFNKLLNLFHRDDLCNLAKLYSVDKKVKCQQRKKAILVQSVNFKRGNQDK